MAWTHNGCPGEGLTLLGLVPVCLRRAVTPTCRSMEFRGKHSRKPESRLAILSSCLCPCLRLRSGEAPWQLSALLSPERQSHLSQMCSKEREMSLPVCPWGSSVPPVPGLLPSFSIGELQCSLDSTPAMVGNSKTPSFELHWL